MKTLRTTLSVIILAITQVAVFAESEVAAPDDLLVNSGAITLGLHGNDRGVRGMGDAFIPVSPLESGLLFINPRVSLNDDGEEEFNFGVGVRSLVFDDQMILGGNVFYDTRWSTYNNRFEQVGAGLEMLSRWFDARANYYYPDDKKDVTASSTTTSSSSSTRTSLGTPFVSGSSILQRRRRVTETTTTTRTFETYETALEGFDAEVGARVPVLTDLATTRVFVGYQRYETPFGSDLDGWKGRVEVRIGEGLLLDAEVFENELLNQADFFVGARLRLPFSAGNLLSGKNPFEGASEAFKPAPTVLAARLGEMVVRDMNIRLDGSSSIENPSKGSETTDQVSRTDILTIGTVPPP